MLFLMCDNLTRRMCFCFLGYTSKIPQKYYGCLDFTPKLFVVLIFFFNKSNCIEEKKTVQKHEGAYPTKYKGMLPRSY
jgi:hypothetical protein